jgi:hypothetical protein
VYWADLDGGKEYHATTLIVMPIDQFIAKYEPDPEDWDDLEFPNERDSEER